MTTLFDPIQAGQLSLANRVVMAPLTRNRAPDAIPTALMAEYYTQRATAGLIITEATAISHQAQGYSDVPGLYGTEQLDGWKQVTHDVHAAGGKIVVQLWHVGRVSHTDLQPDGGRPVAPSAIAAKTKTVLIKEGVPAFVDTSMPRALTARELPDIVHTYQAAARNAVDTAGFDGVEIHGANGYLLDQFLKSNSNQRTDDYGGSMENRARLMLEVTRAVTSAVGGGRTGIRLSPVTPANDVHDSDPQPLFEYVVRELASLQLAYIHIIEGSTGGPRELPDRPFDYKALKTAYRLPRCRRQSGLDGEQRIRQGKRRAGRPCRCRPGCVRPPLHCQSGSGGTPASQCTPQCARQNHLLRRWRQGLHRLSAAIEIIATRAQSAGARCRFGIKPSA